MKSTDVSPNQAFDRSYWFKNRLLMAGLLLLWAFFGLGCGILWADSLNEYRLFNTGYPLGFWFAQQGSIIAFVLIILTYATVMNGLDKAHERQVNQAESVPPSTPEGQT